jgi:hypothetical protein
MSKTGKAFLAICFTALPAFAQPITSVEQIPPLDRTKEDFYGAIVGAGPRVQIEWLLAPASVERGDEVILTLIVTNAANPNELQRPDLSQHPEFRELFEVIENLPGETSAKRVEFRYKLRPRNEGTFAIPLPKYRYYQPQAPEGRRFQLATAPELTLTVTKAKAVEPLKTPIVAPAVFFNMPDVNRFPPKPPRWYWYALFIGAPLIGAAYVVRYWRRHPGEVRLAQIRRVRAVRRALNALNRTEEAGAVAVIFREYLVERIGISPPAQTPREIALELERLSRPSSAQEVEAILGDCERERFDAEVSHRKNLKGAAAAWILKNESEGT